MRSRHLLLTSLAATCFAVSGLVACSSAETPAASTGGQAVTTVTETPVTDQGQTGNCWLYATAGWVESVHANANGSSVHYSPAYWFYWDLYQQLVSGSDAEYGGYWGQAGDIITQYGLLPMGSFAIDDVATQEAAIDALNKAIADGTLTANGTPRDPAAVRAALDVAFNLGIDERALLTQIFGADGTSTFDKGATPAGGIVSAQTFAVSTPVYGRGKSTTTLDVLFGKAATATTSTPDDRTGALAWTAVYPPSLPGFINMMVEDSARPGHRGSVRPGSVSSADAGVGVDAGGADAGPPLVNGETGGGPLPAIPTVSETTWRPLLQRIQRAMNDGAAVPMAWMVNDNDFNKYGAFVKGQTVMPMSQSGGHEVLLSDYQISNVPGYGTLLAGVQATPEQLAASLDDAATVNFFRVKNSWGTSAAKAPVAGYDDVYLGYLMQPTYWCDDIDGLVNGNEDCYPVAPEVWDVVLPPGY